MITGQYPPVIAGLIILNGKQQGVTPAVYLTFTNRVNTHTTAGMILQPARPAPLRLAQHSPASDLGSASFHYYHSVFQKIIVIIEPSIGQTSRFVYPFNIKRKQYCLILMFKWSKGFFSE